mgnify:FL=1
MDKKTLKTLEYDKVLENLAGYASFNASIEKAQNLSPFSNLFKAKRALAETSEARQLLEVNPNTTIGGARDIRKIAEAASRGMVLTSGELLDVKSTLIAVRTLDRQLEKESQTYPNLWEISQGFPGPLGLLDAVTRTISERGDVLDSASTKLGNLRSEIKVAHDRLLSRMQKLLNSAKIAPFLQEAIITQRDGRYVLPVKSDAKGRVKSVIHDISSSGATLFVEPLEVVDLNNQYRELQLAEEDEIRRILAELSDKIGEHIYELQSAVETLAALDLCFACAKYAENLNATAPELVKFNKKKDGTNPGLTMRLYQARHPLLDQDTVVPIDLDLDPSTYVMVITGPNTGGKTVTLKTAGLLALMAQSGMHIPVQAGSQISLFKNIFADIGDEQSIEQSLSTFSGHITNIIKILDKADQSSLVIFDELGAGTDPQEGAALAQAMLSFLIESGIPTLVATHYPELKSYAHATPGVVNASVEFDMDTLSPTYHLMVGLPGRSNALAIAQRLGLQKEIVEKARATIDPSELRAEDLLNEIHRQSELTRAARDAAEKARTDVETVRANLGERLEKIEDERLEIINLARNEAQEEVRNLQEEINKTRQQLARARQPIDAIEEIEEQAESLDEMIEEPAERKEVTENLPQTLKRAIRLGDKVMLRTLGIEGVVTALSLDDAEVQIGNLRIRVELYNLDLISGAVVEKKNVTAAPTGAFKVDSPGIELSLRGKTVDEALESLDAYLDRAYMAGLPYVRVVHGKGTGKLRDAVRREIKGHTQISRFEPGGPSEGGDGVTIIYLEN